MTLMLLMMSRSHQNLAASVNKACHCPTRLQSLNSAQHTSLNAP